jgi:hypothetical protein
MLLHIRVATAVFNEHPAALWEWPSRWSIGAFTPRRVFDEWYVTLWGKTSPNSSPTPTQLVQGCDFSASSCNAKCPLYT